MAEWMSILDAARAYLAAGLCVLPAKRAEKRPAVGRWKQYQQRLPTDAELSAWLANNPDAVCILCGQASGGTEILDFDARGELFDRWCQKVRTDAPGLLERLAVERTPSGGRHVIYRCMVAICGNLKLAQRKDNDKIVTLIETRGEGGLFLCAPTAGYQITQGDLCDLPVLTEAERDILLRTAWELNEYLPPVVDGPARSTTIRQRAALSAENGDLCAESDPRGDCSPNHGIVRQGSASSAPQVDSLSNNAHLGACSSNSAAVGATGPLSAAPFGDAAENSRRGDCPSNNGIVRQRSPSSAPQVDSLSNNAHSGDCSSNSAAVGSTGPLSAASCGDAAENSRRGDCSPNHGTVSQTMAISGEYGEGNEGGEAGEAGEAGEGGEGGEGGRPGDDFNRRGNLRKVLQEHGWTLARAGENEYWRRPGKSSGWSATLKDRVFYVFSANAAPFEPNRAYSPFSVYTLLNHGGDWAAAAGSLRLSGYGGDCLADDASGVDISAIVRLSAAPGACGPHDGAVGQTTALCGEQAACAPEIPDPGAMPEHLFRVPGFVASVMDFTLANAPYPNVGLAFCGAMALQSYLCGRKVCDPGDLRPNLYLLALASSGTGKDFPRKVNSRVLFEIGQVAALGDKFASGEGIQDALARTSAMLFQNDEMDGVLRQINLDRENKRESIPNILLTLYTSANDVYPMRVKAGQKEAAHIDQPHLTLFGTATPQYFYESLSQRMLTNGFFARLIIVDIGKRGQGQKPGSVRNLPQSIIETARWWADYQAGSRPANLLDVHPEPRVVSYTSEAEAAIALFRRQAEQEYDQAHERNDEVARVAWSRTLENAQKLALIYACSENHQSPLIGLPAVDWATAFATHQTRRQLFLASSYVSENPFHAECLKLMRKLRESTGGMMARNKLMRAMHAKVGDFDQIVGTLMAQGDIEPVDIPTKTKTAQGYRLS